MNLMNEDLARAQMSARLGEAQQLRRGHQQAAARRFSRKAEQAARAGASRPRPRSVSLWSRTQRLGTLIAGVRTGARVRPRGRTRAPPCPDLEFGQVKTCDFCGRQEADDARRSRWTTSVENGRARTYCDTCSREHLRAMEGKLDSEWW